MKKIQLTQGKVAIVDDRDYEWLSKYKWCYHHHGYAIRRVALKSTESMHRVIMNTPKGMETDHIDGNKLNNQRNNLRICNSQQNKMNASKSKNKKSSKYKGVSIVGNYYHSSIMINGRTKVKTFPLTKDGEIQAAKHYNELSERYFGEFAKLNPV